MIVQTLVVATVVASCATYAVWTLMPASTRRVLAVALLKLSLPGPLAEVMARHAVASSGCACDGCDKSADAAGKKTAATGPVPGGVAPIVFHPRLRK